MRKWKTLRVGNRDHWEVLELMEERAEIGKIQTAVQRGQLGNSQ
jgi:hypothetical protein